MMGRERRGERGDEGREKRGEEGREGECRGGEGGERKNDLTHPLSQIPGYATASPTP